MRRLLIDIECDSLTPTKIWVMVCRDLDTDKVDIFHSSPGLSWFSDVSLITGHYIFNFDLPVIRDLWGLDFLDLYRRKGIDIRDTLTMSQLMYPDIEGGHSLEAWGKRLKCPKGSFNSWDVLSQEMIDYCVQDTLVNKKLYEFLMKKIGKCSQAIDTENYLSYLCQRMHEHGFPFNKRRAERVRDVLIKQRDILDKSITESFPPKVVSLGSFYPKSTKDGRLSLVGLRWYDGPMEHFSIDSPFTRIKLEPFNPSSPKQVIDRLHEAGWKPTDKTDGYKNNRDKTKAEHFKKYGWKVSETNISSVPGYKEEEEWINGCRIKIQDTEQIITKSTTNGIEPRNNKQPEKVTEEIQKPLPTDSVKDVMVFALKTLQHLYPHRTDVVEFVDRTNHLWSIIVTPQGRYVDCSATFAMDTWAGLRDTSKLHETILTRKAAALLLKRLVIETRIRKLTEWLDLYNPTTGCVHGRFNHIGAWTHRMSHSNPNMANISAKKSIKYNSKELNKTATFLGGVFRSLWRAPKGKVLIGVDAAGIQLRILAHYMNDPKFTHAVTEGNSKDGTDPHTLNMKALGAICKTRDNAKTFNVGRL